MEYDCKGPVLKPLLLIGSQPSPKGTPTELLPFPDGKLAFEHALQTLHSAVPSANTIYISLHDKSRKDAIQFRIDDPATLFSSNAPPGQDHEHHEPEVPKLEVLLHETGHSINPGAGLLAAHALFPDTKWLVLGSEYPLLPPPALQQLILEYEDTVTCYINEKGFVEPLLGIWGPEALEVVKRGVEIGRSDLDGVVKEVGGKLVKPLREEVSRVRPLSIYHFCTEVR